MKYGKLAVRLLHERDGLLQIGAGFLQRRTLRVRTGQLLDERGVTLGKFILTNPTSRSSTEKRVALSFYQC